jgi:predicted nucleic acid-binding protein
LAQFHYDLANQYQVLDVSDAVVARAMSVAQAHKLRAYDAVQLAVAIELNALRGPLGLSTIALISADQELNAAALAEGLLVDDPNSHP